MIRNITVPFLILICVSIATFSQIPTATHIAILKAEDERRYDKTLEDLLKSPNAAIKIRAALAAGRIGNDAAIPALTALLEKEQSAQVREMGAFALGEIESIKAADVILRKLGIGSSTAGGAPPTLSESSRVLLRVAGNGNGGSQTRPLGSASFVTARLLEAAGKIAAANPNDPKSKELGAAIVNVLNEEEKKRSTPSTDVIRLGLTAVLRSRPAGAEETVRRFLAFTDPNIVADALNTLARLRAKNANRDARDMLATHVHAIVRANGARVLGAAEDKEAVDVLIKAATTDSDSRVRVAAIRSLAALRDSKAAESLLKGGETLLDAYKKAKKPNFIPNEHSEFLEVAAALGRMLPNTRNERAVNLFREFGKLDQGHSPEVYIARIRIAPRRGDDTKPELSHWRQYSTLAQVVGEFSALEPTDAEGKQMKSEAPDILRPLVKAIADADPVADANTIKAGPDVLRSFARFKTNDLSEVLRRALKNKDVFIRAAAAELIAEQPFSQENWDDLSESIDTDLKRDTQYNDAQLSILDGLYKLNKRDSVGALVLALNSPDHLIRKKAFDLLKDPEILKNAPGLPAYVDKAVAAGKDRVLPHASKAETKLGQLLNSDADYRRAALRNNGTVKAVLTTEKGTFTIDLLPEDAPLTVDNFIKLARANYFNGLEVHRVVPNFVMQDGDPRGDGNGGPGWSIRCEVNMVPYERGAVGMALSGKDTGGSQWFVTHSPQPHLDGGYAVFGKVNETGMKVVDNIVRGDKILSIQIVERRIAAKRRKIAQK
jgi:cyclophilin family peptidyl-prolyl cis-trans isomerase/HEAT repeat protein